MSVEIAQDQASWEEFLAKTQNYNFLQSWEWGQVQKATEAQAQFLLVNNRTGSLVISVGAKRGNYFLLPHGPVFQDKEYLAQDLVELVSYLKTNAKEFNCVAVRVSPLLLRSSENEEVFSQAGFRPAPTHVHAEETWVLPLDKTLDEIFSQMRKTTRHAVRKAKKAGIEVEVTTAPDTSDRFWQLYTGTAKRHEFIVWPKDVIAKQLEEFGKKNKIFAVFAKIEGQDVAAAICIQYGNSVFYYHGASKKLSSSQPAAQLVQWTAIQEAKNRGADFYNFWGIAPAGKPNHPFAGITVFKKGFGGQELDYMHAQDLPLGIDYWKLFLVDSWRRLKRGF